MDNVFELFKFKVGEVVYHKTNRRKLVIIDRVFSERLGPGYEARGSDPALSGNVESATFYECELNG